MNVVKKEVKGLKFNFENQFRFGLVWFGLVKSVMIKKMETKIPDLISFVM